MKIEAVKYITVIALAIFLWDAITNPEEDTEPEPVTIVIPETTGTTGLVEKDTIVKVDTIYLNKVKTVIDAKYKKLYEESKDSVERLNLYMEAIKIQDYKETLIDNEEVKIVGQAKVRGELINYKVDYTIKPKNITYTPEVIVKYPRLSLELGLVVGTPTLVGESVNVVPQVGLVRKDGWGFNYGYDVVNKKHFVGIKKSIKLIK